MKDVIHKQVIDYALLGFSHIFVATMPSGSKIVHFAEQGGMLVFWYQRPLVAETSEKRRFRVVGTGNPFEEGLFHRGTALLDDGSLVLHLMEIMD